MKKSILLIAIATTLSTVCLAQVKPPADTAKKTAVTPKRPGWVFNPDLPITFTLSTPITLSAVVVSNYMYVITHGGAQAINDSDLPSITRRVLLSDFNRVQARYTLSIDSLTSQMINQYRKVIKTSHEQFSADSIRKYHPDK